MNGRLVGLDGLFVALLFLVQNATVAELNEKLGQSFSVRFNVECSQVVVDIGHVVSVAEGFLVGPFGFIFASGGTENVGQVSVGCAEGGGKRRH